MVIILRVVVRSMSFSSKDGLTLAAAAAGGALIAGCSFAAAYKLLNKPEESLPGDCPGFEGPEKRLEINIRPVKVRDRTEGSVAHR